MPLLLLAVTETWFKIKVVLLYVDLSNVEKCNLLSTSNKCSSEKVSRYFSKKGPSIMSRNIISIIMICALAVMISVTTIIIGFSFQGSNKSLDIVLGIGASIVLFFIAFTLFQQGRKKT